eukprot:TRINITY_DN846_c0_g2_i2.p1 TRINITY_DN846_c0_g2~~TRINITY_DN846_c0_g2_i2.p1  ORF type:complete len:516 (-),score=126.49 TRINITY_DN846_c0_g2_i2:60-1586(-)
MMIRSHGLTCYGIKHNQRSQNRFFKKRYSLSISSVKLDINQEEIDHIKRVRFGQEFSNFKRQFEQPIIDIYKNIKENKTKSKAEKKMEFEDKLDQEKFVLEKEEPGSEYKKRPFCRVVPRHMEDDLGLDQVLDGIVKEVKRDPTGPSRYAWLLPRDEEGIQEREEIFKGFLEGRSNYAEMSLYRPDIDQTTSVMVGTSDSHHIDDMMPSMPIGFTDHNKWEWENSLSWDDQLKIMTKQLMDFGFDVERSDTDPLFNAPLNEHQKWSLSLSIQNRTYEHEVYTFPKIRKSTIEELRDLREKKDNSDPTKWRDADTVSGHPLVLKNKPWDKRKNKKDPIVYVDKENPLMFMTTELVNVALANETEEFTTKVHLKVKVSELKMPENVFDRFKQITQMRYNEEEDILTLISDKKPSQEENKTYLLGILRNILNESWNADLNYVPIETVAPHIQVEDEIQIEREEKEKKEKWSSTTMDFSQFTFFNIREIPSKEERIQKEEEIQNLLKTFSVQ